MKTTPNLQPRLQISCPAPGLREPAIVFNPISLIRDNKGFGPSPSRPEDPKRDGLKPLSKAGAVIYVIDNEPSLAELYRIVLEMADYRVRAFTNREQVLTALENDQIKPDLLITDFLGHLMPVDWFMFRCRVLSPSLRILVASGFLFGPARCSLIKPDRFLHKPFTAETFLREVHEVLAA